MESQLQQEEVKKPLEVWQAVASFVLIIGTIIGLYASAVAKSENHEVRIKQLESDRSEIKADIKETKQIVTDIRVLLQNKADKK